jgi:hypothetical protein
VESLETITLQCPEKIRISKFAAQLFENAPVSFARVDAEVPLEMIPQVLFDAIVVQERVVDIE